jgi:glucosyl-dolichyl phosphate glucuronosyltransferase
VAVCTGRAAALVRPALERLAGQRERFDRLIVVTSGLNGAALDEHERQARALAADVVAEPLPGLSRARNRALAALGNERVIAFVDDDALAAPDWAERLGARWAAAASDVGCIGGAIVPGWRGAPPRWAAGDVLRSYSLLDLGPGLRNIVPPDEEVYGANISFAADALRAVGGFDHARGAWADVPLAGEESHVQRRMVERRWRVLYAGDVWVEHVIAEDRLSLRSMLRRRFYYGASGDEVLGAPRDGVRRSGKAAVGAAISVARGDHALAGERAARAAVNAGLAAAPIVRRRLRRRGWPGPPE